MVLSHCSNVGCRPKWIIRFSHHYFTESQENKNKHIFNSVNIFSESISSPKKRWNYSVKTFHWMWFLPNLNTKINSVNPYFCRESVKTVCLDCTLVLQPISINNVQIRDFRNIQVYIYHACQLHRKFICVNFTGQTRDL